MRITHQGREFDLEWSESCRTFALVDDDGDVELRFDPPASGGAEVEPNESWVDERHLPLLIAANVVEPTDETRSFGGTTGHLVRIVHDEFHDGGYSPFGDFSRQRLGEQCQYGSRYIDGRGGCPALGEGLRFRNLKRGYHFIRIHRDDMDEFERRYRAHAGPKA